jgi:cupin-like protein
MEARWQAWLVENLLLGVPASDLVPTLVTEGHSAAEVEEELARAQSHPYLAGAKKVAERLVRREWLLRTLTQLRDLDPRNLVLEPSPFPGTAAFLSDHYACSRPALFRGLVEDWPALEWTPASLGERFGEREVEVQWGRSKDPLYEPRSNHYKRRVPFRELSAAIASGPSNDVYLTANNGRANAWLAKELLEDVVTQGSLGVLDEILDPAQLLESTFVWVGPEGVVTPLHHDMTNNLFVQVHGRKRFYLASAIEVDGLYNHHHVYSSASLREPDLEACPELERVRVFEVDLEPGDVLFLPIGWWHEVVGLSPSISLTFTAFRWLNSFPRANETQR